MRKFAGVIVLGLSLAACSSGTPSGSPDSGSFFTCDEDSDCNDMTDCTVDSCAVGGTCSFMAIDALCAAGETCRAGMGCVAGTPCDDNADCDDTIACTVDSCGVGGMCRHMALNDLCTDPAAGTCDPTMGCVAGSGCTSAASCDDAIDCTVDSCGADMTCRHTTVNERCATGQVCSATMGCYTPRPCTTAAECDDGNFCNGAEECVPEFGCAEATAPRTCNDSDACTIDSCDTTADMCVFACDSSRSECGCPTTGATCAGTFAMTGSGLSYSCIGGLVGHDLSQVTFVQEGGAIIVRPSDLHTFDSDTFSTRTLEMAGIDMVCPTIEAVATVTGGCTETYRITGTFTDDDHFTGMFQRTYTGDCSGCVSGTATLTGTRL